MGAQVVATAAHGLPALEQSDAHPPHVVDRYTKGGRRLWYCLKVIQQPERARACGSGPKSSADRRPVDPPPVVELRIYEGQTWEIAQDKDITFVYNANFFLYATLEHARAIIHGRVPAPAANTPPVLTGMPVSGMAYLDRPQEAGYFLFPDLSVRHEGRYKLTFNLYEETKEDKDKDHDEPEASSIAPGINGAPGGSFDWRMEAKSQEFMVYSAKKFPGLTESTALSRVVAEQGCRVRIRRDVRMRRRDGKGGNGDYDNGNNNNEDEFARRRRTSATPSDVRPVVDAYRARSTSGSAERTPYSADPQRRPSLADYPPQYPAQNPSSGGHLQFLGANPSSQYSSSQSQSFAQPPSVPASPVYPPSQGASYPGQSSYPRPPTPSSSYSTERTPSQSYVPINPSPRRESSLHDYRSSLSSAGSSSITLPPLSLPPFPHAAQHGPQGAQERRQALPPLQVDPNAGSYGRMSIMSPSTITSSRQSSLGGPSSAGFPRPVLQYAGTKRAHNASFGGRDFEVPRFQDGAREEPIVESDPLDATYRRANGEVGMKRFV
ncbi:velvet factor-domain-containing protein, partial [Cercophora scortea]